MPRDHPLVAYGIIAVLAVALVVMSWKLYSDSDAARAGKRIIKKLNHMFEGLDCTLSRGQYDCPVIVHGLGSQFTAADALDEAVVRFCNMLSGQDAPSSPQQQPPQAQHKHQQPQHVPDRPRPVTRYDEDPDVGTPMPAPAHGGGSSASPQHMDALASAPAPGGGGNGGGGGGGTSFREAFDGGSMDAEASKQSIPQRGGPSEKPPR